MVRGSKPNSSTALVAQNCTAVLIVIDGPARLREIGREILDRLKDGNEHARIFKDHDVAIERLIAEAEELCDVDGFNKFWELICPELGKSQSYKWRAIARGKTTLLEQRNKERERKRRSRAKQKVKAQNSGTVPENSTPQEAPKDLSGTEAATVAPEQMTEQPKRLGSIEAACNTALCEFNGHVRELCRKMNKRSPDWFFKTAIPVADLERVGRFLIDIAILKKSDSVPVTPSVDINAVSVEHQISKTEHTSRETSGDWVGAT